MRDLYSGIVTSDAPSYEIIMPLFLCATIQCQDITSQQDITAHVHWIIKGMNWSDLVSNEEIAVMFVPLLGTVFASLVTSCNNLMTTTKVIYQFSPPSASWQWPHNRPYSHWKDINHQDLQQINLALPRPWELGR